jgi:hypothetical protein
MFTTDMTDGETPSTWADHQIGEAITEIIFAVRDDSGLTLAKKRRMITALIRRQNAFLDKAEADRHWDSPEHFFSRVPLA